MDTGLFPFSYNGWDFCALYHWLPIRIHPAKIAPMENSMIVPQKIENRTNIWSSSSTSRYVFEGNEITVLKIYLLPQMFIAALFTAAKIRKPPVSIDRWMNKAKCYMYTIDYYSGIRKKEILSFPSTWKNLGSIMLS